MTSPITLTVSLAERSYPIHIGENLLQHPETWLTQLPRVALISNDTLWPLYGEKLMQQLQSINIRVIPIILPDGEAHKNTQTLNHIYDNLLLNNCDRKTTLLALGGGVIGDLVGFAAATYQRGVPFIQIPTTLLAQVDSSVGGKTAINHPRGKNMIGAFYQPQQVIIDTTTLKTLPMREYRSGLAEIIKYGVGLDQTFFEWLEANLQALIDQQPETLAYAIHRSCQIKAEIVAADERETAKEGGRALLNLGHTFGHAIETALGYGQWLHGEAVACGIALAAQFSVQQGHLKAADCTRIISLLNRAGLPTTYPNIAPSDMLEHMGRDKKNENGVIRLILLNSIGQSYTDSRVSAQQIHDYLNTLMHA